MEIFISLQRMEFLMELPLLCLADLISQVANVHMQYLLYVGSWCAK